MRRTPRTPGDPVPAVMAALRSRALHPELVVDCACGEPDRRIRIASAQGIVVELLCYEPPRPTPPRWLAVRVDGDDRVVWRGPEVAGAPEEAAQFVEDLLRLGPAELAGRYPALG